MNRQKLRGFNAHHDKAICLHLALKYALLIRYRFFYQMQTARLKALLYNVHMMFQQGGLTEKDLHRVQKSDLTFFYLNT